MTYLPAGINDSGVIAGTNVSTPIHRGFFLVKKKITPVSSPTGTVVTEIFGIDNSETLAGTGCLTAACDSTRATTWQIRHGGSTWERLPPPKGSVLCTHNGCNSQANGIGPSGDVAGQFGTQAELWLRGTKDTYTSKRLPYTESSHASSSSGLEVDSFGDVVGVEKRGLLTVAVLWPRHAPPVTVPGCGTLLVVGGATFEYPDAVLAKGSTGNRTVTIAGKCLVLSQTTHHTGFAPCVWRATISGSLASVSPPVRLDTNGGSAGGGAAAMNQKGWIAGNQGDANSSATLWVNQQPHLLNNLIPANSGWNLGSVYAMNNKDQVTGIGTFNGHTTGFLLTPK